MTKFTRGTVVEHKVMGKGVVLNDVDDNGYVEVRMANGHIEKYYPEEMETEDEVNTKYRNRIAQTTSKWRDAFE